MRWSSHQNSCAGLTMLLRVLVICILTLYSKHVDCVTLKKKKQLKGCVGISCTQRSTSLVLNMLLSMCCCDDVIFATLDKMNDETSPTLLKLSHTKSCFCSRRKTWEFWCVILLADAPNEALNLLKSSSGICHFVYKYFFLKPSC